MNKATMRDREALAFLALLHDNGACASAADGTQARRRYSFQRRLWATLAVYALTVIGASGVLFLIGVLLRRW